METRSNVVAIGLFVIGIMAMALTSLYWLATTGEATEETELVVAFPGAVTGLSKGASVFFNGIKIGSVSRIEFSKNDPTRVLAYAIIDAAAPLKKDTTAELGFQGLTGVAYIEMKGGTISSEDLLGGTGTPTIVANPSFFQDVLDTARGVMSKADVTLSEINALLKDNRGPLTNTFANVESFSKALADNSENISTFLADISTAGKSFASLSKRLENLVDGIDPVLAAVDPETITKIMKDAAVLTKQLADASGKIDTMITNAEAASEEARNFAAGLNSSLKSVDGILAAVDQQKVANTIDGLEAIAGSFKDRKEDVSAMIVDARGAAKNVNTITERLASRADDIEGMIVDARSAVQNADKLTESLAATAVKADKIVEAVKPETVTGTLDNVNNLTGRLAARSDDVDKIITNTSATLEETRTAAKNLKEITGSLNARTGSVDKIITNVETATDKLPTITTDISAALEQVRILAQAVEADKINAAVDNVSKLTGRLAERGDDIDAIILGARKSTENVESITGALAAKSKDVQSIVDQALSLSQRLNAASVRIDGLLAKADGMLGDEETGGLISEARRAATSVANIAQAFESRANRISQGVERLTTSSVSKFEKLLDIGQNTLRQIERSVQNLEQNPQRVLFGGPKVRQVGGNRR